MEIDEKNVVEKLNEMGLDLLKGRPEDKIFVFKILKKDGECEGHVSFQAENIKQAKEFFSEFYEKNKIFLTHFDKVELSICAATSKIEEFELPKISLSGFIESIGSLLKIAEQDPEKSYLIQQVFENIHKNGGLDIPGLEVKKITIDDLKEMIDNDEIDDSCDSCDKSTIGGIDISKLH